MEADRFEVHGIPVVDMIQTEVSQTVCQTEQTNGQVALSEVQVTDAQWAEIPDNVKSVRVVWEASRGSLNRLNVMKMM